MSGKRFEAQVARLDWQPGARPRAELVDSVLQHHGRDSAREIAPAVWGVLVGALIGLLLKGMSLESAAWGPGSGLLGLGIGAVALSGLLASIFVAAKAARLGRKAPRLLQFASINLLTLALVQLV